MDDACNCRDAYLTVYIDLYLIGRQMTRRRRKSKKKWIAGAIKKPGALRKTLKIKKGKTIPLSKLRAAAKKKGVTGRRARLALTMRKMSKRRR